MKTYKLLRDMPTVKAGTTFREITREVDGSKILKEYKSSNKVSILVSEVNDFDEWFEKIEPTDSAHWKPQRGDNYWIAYSDGEISKCYWNGCPVDIARYEMGRTYRTREECEKALVRELAEIRLRRTSTFKPDFENRNGGWAVGYNHHLKMLTCSNIISTDFGEPVRYATAGDARRSIEENEQDWKIYFGVEEEE